MPIYEYECTKCGNITEALQKFSDPPLTDCEHCGGSLEKLISRSAFHLKGSGWYVTDYARGRSSSCSSSACSTGTRADTGGSGSAAAPEKPADPVAKADTKSGTE